MSQLSFCFNSVQFFSEPFGGIASTNYETGDLYINLYKWRQLTREQQAFVLCHEEGHVINKSANEDEADTWASNKYLNAGYSITASVTALTQLLSNGNKQHIQRAYNQLQRAIDFNNKK